MGFSPEKEGRGEISFTSGPSRAKESETEASLSPGIAIMSTSTNQWSPRSGTPAYRKEPRSGKSELSSSIFSLLVRAVAVWRKVFVQPVETEVGTWPVWSQKPQQGLLKNFYCIFLVGPVLSSWTRSSNRIIVSELSFLSDFPEATPPSPMYAKFFL